MVKLPERRSRGQSGETQGSNVRPVDNLFTNQHKEVKKEKCLTISAAKDRKPNYAGYNSSVLYHNTSLANVTRLKVTKEYVFGCCVPEFIVEGRALLGRRGRVVGDRAAAGLLPLLISHGCY